MIIYCSNTNWRAFLQLSELQSTWLERSHEKPPQILLIQIPHSSALLKLTRGTMDMFLCFMGKEVPCRSSQLGHQGETASGLNWDTCPHPSWTWLAPAYPSELMINWSLRWAASQLLPDTDSTAVGLGWRDHGQVWKTYTEDQFSSQPI